MPRPSVTSTNRVLCAASLLVGALAACSRERSEPLAPASSSAAPARAATAATHGRLSEIAAGPDSLRQVDVQIELGRLHTLDEVLALADQEGIEIHGVVHGFRAGDAVQTGGYDQPASSRAEWLEGYRLSTREFLTTSVRLAAEAIEGARDAKERRSLVQLLGHFKARLAQFDAGKQGIYAVRGTGPAAHLVSLRARRPEVSAMTTRRASGKFRTAQQPGDLSPMMIVCDDPSLPGCDGGTDPDPIVYEQPEIDQTLVPLSSYALSSAPPPPEADPGRDETRYDDNSVNNRWWAPRAGKSYVDRDQYSKYSYQYISWAQPRLEFFRWDGANGRGSFEHEVHQDKNFPRSMYAPGFYRNYRQEISRGEVWESSMPAPYIDSQFGDGWFAGKEGVQNTTVGSNRPDLLVYDQVYYNWIRFDQYGVGSGSGEIQIAAQLGTKTFSACESSAWCTLASARTVRVLPWMCNYRAPNSVYVYGNNHWKNWYYDGYGYKNEQCAETGY